MSTSSRSTRPPTRPRHPILFVDDDPPNLELLTYMLSEQYTVVGASNGQEALARLKEEHFAILLCDQRMPGMTGVEVCARARLVSPHTVRILLTAYTDGQAAVDAINEGAVSRYLSKPIDAAELQAVVTEELAQYDAALRLREAGSTLLHEGLALAAQTAEAEIAHDVNNMITPVSLLLDHGMSQLRDARKRNRDRALDAAVTSISEAVRGMNVLQQFVRSLREGQRESRSRQCDMGEVVDATVRMFGPRTVAIADVSVSIDEVAPVPIDAAALTQIFMNLLTNALDAIEEQGQRAAIQVRVEGVDQVARLTVRDEGGGIDPQALPKIFDGRFTTRSSGTGRGLAIARRLTEAAGGTISVSSEPGWTEFVVTLPTLDIVDGA